jgi:ATP-dependent Lhr-like helicase
MAEDPDYSPASSRELLDWIKERLLIPWGEWDQLLLGMQRDHGLDPDSILAELKSKLVRIHPPNANEALVAAREMIDLILDHGYRWEREVRVQSWEGLPFFREDSWGLLNRCSKSSKPGQIGKDNGP